MSLQVFRASKGKETRTQILEAAIQQASQGGFESITIGTLAEFTGMSKSGLFAHFGSRTDLQIAVLDETARRFTEAVFLPAMKAPRGLTRLRAIFANWLVWPERAKLRGSCPILAAFSEYDDRPGPMREALLDRQRLLARELAKAVHLAVESGELRADTDVPQFVFEMSGIELAYSYALRLLGDAAASSRALAAFERLVQANRPSTPVSRPAARRR
ncbi:MAG: TetR/AcrR family transcriptional regulator [Betaproteobacteria bacterium]|nr:TetR/AcrR family transcriptional regulator [Betaproteobacteria bacterium]